MTSAGISHQGLVRANNEDRIYFDDEHGIYMVIDGMGGQAAGEQAAAIALERIRSRLARQTDAVDRRVREAIALANNAIYEAAARQPEWRGMACVLTVAVVEQGVATIGHVGDSRLYKIRGGRMGKITRDHSPVGEREDRGEIGEREAMADPRRNEVFRDVGSEPHTPDDENFIQIERIRFEPDSALLLCTDGLSDVVASAEILGMVQQRPGDVRRAVEDLIEAANRNSKDNVSVVLVEGSEFGVSEKTAPRMHRTPWWRGGPAMAAMGVVAGILAVLALQRAMHRETPPPAPAGPQRFVTGPALSISAALAKAQPGDTVEVAPGEYAEQIRLKEGVSLIARKLREAVLRPRAVGGAPVVGILAENLHSARVWGLTVQGTEESGLAAGISVRNSAVDIQHCEITGARIAGVEYLGASEGTLEGSYIHHNPGAGVIVRHPAFPRIESNLIVENGKGPGHLLPGVEILSLANPALVSNTIAANGAEAVWTRTAPEQGAFDRNFFSLDGKPSRRRPVRVLGPGDAP